MGRSIWIGVVLAGAMTWAGEVLRVDFDRDPAGAYSYDSCKAEFPGVKWNNGLTPDSANRVQVVQGGDSSWSGRSLRVLYPAGCLGPSGTGGAPACGAQWRSLLPGAYDTLWARYRVYFPSGFEWTKGGKLPGLCGSLCNTGGNPPTGSDGWSARMMWRDSARLVLYVYSAGQGGTYGTDVDWKDSTGAVLRVATGMWHELVTKVSLNTPGIAGGAGAGNGRIQAWFDGVPAADTAGFRFRDPDTMHVNQFYFSTFFGGSTSDFSPAHDNRIFFDEFTVSSDPLVTARPSATKRKPTPSPPVVKTGSGRISWGTDGGPARAQLLDPNGVVLASLSSQGTEMSVALPSGARGALAWHLSERRGSSSGIVAVP